MTERLSYNDSSNKVHTSVVPLWHVLQGSTQCMCINEVDGSIGMDLLDNFHICSILLVQSSVFCHLIYCPGRKDSATIKASRFVPNFCSSCRRTEVEGKSNEESGESWGNGVGTWEALYCARARWNIPRKVERFNHI